VNDLKKVEVKSLKIKQTCAKKRSICLKLVRLKGKYVFQVFSENFFYQLEDQVQKVDIIAHF